MTEKPPHNAAYLLFSLGISILALIILCVFAIVPIDAAARRILEYADTAICALFFLDFLVTLFRSERKLRYLATWGLLDLLSSVPMVEPLRVGRLARVVRILRILRGVRSARILSAFVLQRRAQSAFLAASLVTIILIVLGSIAIVEFEKAPDANIRGPQDAVWWTVVTLTTVGYGDRYPVTPEGRVVAVILMIAGVGLFGTLSGFVAAWFLSPAGKKAEDEVALLRREIEALRKSLDITRKE